MDNLTFCMDTVGHQPYPIREFIASGEKNLSSIDESPIEGGSTRFR